MHARRHLLRQLARLDDERHRPRHARDDRDRRKPKSAPGAIGVRPRRATSSVCVNFIAASATFHLRPRRGSQSAASTSARAPAPSASCRSAAMRSSSTRSRARSSRVCARPTSTVARGARRSGRAPVGLIVAPKNDRIYVKQPWRGDAERARRRRRPAVGRSCPSERARAASSSTRSISACTRRERRKPARCRSSKTCSRPRRRGRRSRSSIPLVGQKLPAVPCSTDFRTGERRSSTEWAERKYILNFFASW